MGEGLRFSPLEYDSTTKSFTFGGYSVEGLVSSVINTSGNVRYVNNGNSIAVNHLDAGKSRLKPWRTLNYAAANCSAGDVVVCMAGHNESVVAAAGLDFNTAGITVIFDGQGASKAKITFSTAVGADMNIDAASITLINPKFVAGIDALTGPIDVNAADFTMINAEYYDATSINTIDAVIADANATRMKLLGYKFFRSTEGGTQKQSHIQMNGTDDAVLKGIHIRGNFATGNIENVTDEVLNITLEDIVLDNMNTGPQPCMVLDADADGHARDLHFRVYSGTTYVSSTADINWGANCLGFSADGYGGDHIGPAASDGVEGKIDTVISDLATITSAASDLTIVSSDLAILSSDLTATVSDLAATQDTIASDLVIVQSDVKVIGSDLIVTNAIVDTIASDMVVTNAIVDTIASDMVVAQSDIKVIGSDLIVTNAIVDTVASDVVIVMSDLKSTLSDLKVLDAEMAVVDALIDTINTNVSTANAGIVVIDAIVDDILSDTAIIASDLIVTNAIVDTIASDMIVTNAIVDTVASDLIIVDTVVDKVSSDLIAFMAKYASDNP